MLKVALIGQKGGTGKTTLALGFAVVAAQAGLSVAVIDLDPQSSSANWKDRRDAENPAVVATPIGRFKQALEAAEAAGADVVVIDTPGKSESAAIEAARAANVVLIPVAAQVFELETLAGFRDLLRVAGDPATFVVLNNVHPQAVKLAEGAKAMAHQVSGLRVCPVHICGRDVYATAPAIGLTPSEVEPEGKAADELRRLYKFVSEL